MPISTSSAPHDHESSPAATPGQNCDVGWKPDTPRAPHRSTRQRHAPATPAPPTPPAAAPSNAGTQNAAGSPSHPKAQSSSHERPPGRVLVLKLALRPSTRLDRAAALLQRREVGERPAAGPDA